MILDCGRLGHLPNFSLLMWKVLKYFNLDVEWMSLATIWGNCWKYWCDLLQQISRSNNGFVSFLVCVVSSALLCFYMYRPSYYGLWLPDSNKDGLIDKGGSWTQRIVSSYQKILTNAHPERRDSEREPFYDDIAHVIQNTKKYNQSLAICNRTGVSLQQVFIGDQTGLTGCSVCISTFGIILVIIIIIHKFLYTASPWS